MIERSIPDKPLDLNEWAYKTIHMRILNHEIKPGSQLNIEELSKELNISRTPIREALLRLKQNGLVVSFTRVGFFVCGITKNDFEDIFELRQLFESYAVENFVKKAADIENDQLLNLSKQCKKMAEQGNLEEYNNYDSKLHDLFIDKLGNKKMRDIYGKLGDLLYIIRIYALNSNENIKQSLIEHDKIIQAVKIRDALKARIAMEEHIKNIRDRLRLIVDFFDDSMIYGAKHKSF